MKPREREDSETNATEGQTLVNLQILLVLVAGSSLLYLVFSPPASFVAFSDYAPLTLAFSHHFPKQKALLVQAVTIHGIVLLRDRLHISQAVCQPIASCLWV